MIGMFLSKCYFQSRNCLREVVGTLEQKKPYLLVHEANPAKGGAPLESLQLELNDETHREVLFDGRRITAWHRILEFQLISLLQIAEDMLLCSPEYTCSTTLPLYVPGSLLELRFVFSEPVVLFVSDKNPGAAEAAAEMTSLFSQLSVNSALPLPTIDKPLRRNLVISPNFAKAKSLAHTSHMAQPMQWFLLYLNKWMYMGPEGEAFSAQVRVAQKAGMPIAMVHENDPDRNGCEFETFFRTTPIDLIQCGLYASLATPFMSGENHRRVSHALLARTLGAKVAKGVASLENLQTAAVSLQVAAAAARNLQIENVLESLTSQYLPSPPRIP